MDSERSTVLHCVSFRLYQFLCGESRFGDAVFPPIETSGDHAEVQLRLIQHFRYGTFACIFNT